MFILYKLITFYIFYSFTSSLLQVLEYLNKNNLEIIDKLNIINLQSQLRYYVYIILNTVPYFFFDISMAIPVSTLITLFCEIYDMHINNINFEKKYYLRLNSLLYPILGLYLYNVIIY